MIAITVLIAIAAVILLLPTLSDLISLGRVPRATRQEGREMGGAPARFLFLIPAHDEELLIDSCLRSVRALAYPPDLINAVVIADNCSDRTAAVARAAGFRCLERTDPVHRGKPWALAWALERIPLDQYDGVVIMDADAVVAPDFAVELAKTAPLTGKALQPFNGVSNWSEHALTRLGAVFALSRFHFVNALKQRVGLNVPLANGLCIGTGVLREHGWHAFSICEDWEMYAILTERGIRTENVPGARIFSQEARSLQQSSSQRRRWTAGRLAIVRSCIPGLVRNTRVQMHQKLDCLAEMTAPGPVAHAALVIMLVALVIAVHPPGTVWLVIALATSLLRNVIYTIAALRMDPEPGKALLAFSYLPVYAVWRLGVQVASLAAISGRLWVRTERHAQAASSARPSQLDSVVPHAIRTADRGIGKHQP